MTDVHDPNVPDMLPSAQVLTNTDLLHYIFMFVPSSPNSGRNSYLARCAVVCRTFHEPAIRVLWRNLNSLLPLWHLLAPLDTPYPYSAPVYLSILSHLRGINTARLYLDPTRWDRFQEHAAHVRRIAYDARIYQGNLNRDVTSLLQSVIAQNGGKTVLPLLQTIEWLRKAPGDDTLIPLCTSTLRRITIDSRGLDQTAHVPLFRRLHESSPFLETINLFTPDDLGARPSVIVKELVRFSRLQQIQLSRISDPEAAFHTLATMPHLTSLSVFSVTGTWAGNGHAISFRGLQELSVKGSNSVLLGLFNRVRFPALESAMIGSTNYYRAQVALEDVTAFLSLFSNAISPGRLHTLQLGFPMAPPARRSDLPTLRDLLSPILPLHHLHNFNIDASDTITTLDDPDVDALARAWPGLERLHIASSLSRESNLSLHALCCLRTHCRHLRELSVPRLVWPIIGVHSLPAPPSLESPIVELGPVSGESESSAKPHALRRLAVRGTCHPRMMSTAPLEPELSDEGVEATARYLLDLFPGLEREQYKEATQERLVKIIVGFDDPGRWRKVSGRLYALCCARDGLPLSGLEV